MEFYTPQSTSQALIHLPNAVDWIRFEKNLLQMGFFGAHDTRHKTESTRRIEQTVIRSGQKVKVAAEFRASQELGLPSTSDRDKYIAFMRIVMEERKRRGTIPNTIRFTGYRLLKELGLCDSGENYEDINRWGQRMADTTITSEQVIYLAARKRYTNKTVHVFRSFQRSGTVDFANRGRVESYEVVLEDWLLDNLNQNYVVPEDYNAYRKLRRPTAKGIFGYLHLWFHASEGRTVEKDYAELCELLNIPAYRHLSKIRQTMGKSLDELGGVGYLTNWDVQRMATKEGFKLVLSPGQELLRVLAISQKRQLAPADTKDTPLSESQKTGIQELISRGVTPQKAESLARDYDPDYITAQIKLADRQMSGRRRAKFDNPAGFVIHLIENGSPVPVVPATAGPKQPEVIEAIVLPDQPDYALLLEYHDFLEKAADEEFTRRLPPDILETEVKKVSKPRHRRSEIKAKRR